MATISDAFESMSRNGIDATAERKRVANRPASLEPRVPYPKEPMAYPIGQWSPERPCRFVPPARFRSIGRYTQAEH